MSHASPLLAGSARASIAYGSINNFDTVNDTGSECHGFEIEIEDCHSTDITYTYDYNHYGTPKITQDDSIAGHPKCVIRWESKKNPDGIMGVLHRHPQRADQSDRRSPVHQSERELRRRALRRGLPRGGGRDPLPLARSMTARATLVHGGAVQVSTPSFTYYPPVAGDSAAQVQAVIEPPPPAPEFRIMEFGPAVWVKEIRTTTHNNNEVELRDLVSEDPDDPDDVNWRNGEPDEVEVEWQILQKELQQAGRRQQRPPGGRARGSRRW